MVQQFAGRNIDRSATRALRAIYANKFGDGRESFNSSGALKASIGD